MQLTEIASVLRRPVRISSKVVFPLPLKSDMKCDLLIVLGVYNVPETPIIALSSPGLKYMDIPLRIFFLLVFRIECCMKDTSIRPHNSLLRVNPTH